MECETSKLRLYKQGKEESSMCTIEEGKKEDGSTTIFKWKRGNDLGKVETLKAPNSVRWDNENGAGVISSSVLDMLSLRCLREIQMEIPKRLLNKQSWSSKERPGLERYFGSLWHTDNF